MQCARCQHENRSGAKFCEECAAPLARVCASCGARLSAGANDCPECAHPTQAASTRAPRFSAPQAYIPKHLAEKIFTAKQALEGERKQVTVLFADLKGSMELLADRDPEDAGKLLDPVIEHMMEAVHRYEGTVNQVMGDGIMGLFGAPVAHEDHAVRACYAALRMQESVRRYAEEVLRRHGVPVEIRVGLNSGEVVVRTIGSDLRMDYTAIGQTTHLAARMEQMARPGTILLAPDTVALVEGFMQVISRGAAPVKGLAAPIEIFQLVGAKPIRSRLRAAASRGLTRFVGREVELELLRRALERAGEGHGQVIAVVGEPGVGKSRLIWEFTHSRPCQGWLVLETASVSYARATSYFAVIELLRGYFGIEPRDDNRRMREKVTGKLLSQDRALEPSMLPAFLSLLDVPVEDAQWTKLEPSERRRQTLEALKRLVVRESQMQPVLLVVEDLHWADSETQASLDLLIESLPRIRLLLLVNYRPEYGHASQSNVRRQQLQLDALPMTSAEELLEAILGTGPDLAGLRRLLIARTQGNPFFLEESVRALVETRALTGESGAYRLARPIGNLQLPATAHAILAARIDRLALADKRMLQCAAVIGKDVPFVLLQAIIDEPEETLRLALARLQAAEFLYEARLFPDLEYTFKHALTHEVAYASLLLERRRALHLRVLEAMENIYAERRDEQVEHLAHHAVRGDAHEKAVRYLREAGLKAVARSALQDARAWFEQALDALTKLPESPATLQDAFEIRLELRPVLVQLGDVRQALARLQEAESIAERLDDDGKRGRVLAFMTNVHSLFGELEEALAAGTRALAIAGGQSDLRLRLLTTTYLEQAHYFRGEYERAVQIANENLAALPHDWGKEFLGNAAPVSVYDRSWMVHSLGQLGRFAEAADYADDALRLAVPMRHSFIVGFAYLAAGTLALLKGDWTAARSRLDHAIGTLRTGNVVLLLPFAVPSLALVLAQLGEDSDAADRLEESERLLERESASGIVVRLGWAYHALGRAALLLGRLDEAQRLGGRAIEFAARQPGFKAHALRLLGDIASSPDRFNADAAERYYEEALAHAEPRRMRPLVAHCHLGLGKLYRCIGKREQMREHLATAMTLYREMDMDYWLQQAEIEMRMLALVPSRPL